MRELVCKLSLANVIKKLVTQSSQNIDVTVTQLQKDQSGALIIQWKTESAEIVQKGGLRACK